METENLPPTDFDALPAEPAAWPKVVGIISIVWGSLGLFCGVCGMLSPIIVKSMMPANMGELPPQMSATPMMMGMVAVGMILSLICLTSGALCVARNPVTKPMHVVYAILAIAIGIWNLNYQLHLQADMKQWALDHPDSPFAKGMTGPGQGIGQAIGLLFGVVLGFGYPLFLIVWFGLIKRKAALR